jgi:hypothetical protein
MAAPHPERTVSRGCDLAIRDLAREGESGFRASETWDLWVRKLTGSWTWCWPCSIRPDPASRRRAHFDWVLPKAMAATVARLELYGITILLGVLIVLPLLRAQLGVDLNMAHAALHRRA